jgi:multiple sugar transport system substrate-binding protein
MRRGVIAAVLVVAVIAAVVGATARSSAHAGTKADNLTIWVGWSARELSAFKKIAAEYDKNHPEVTIKVVGGINDDKIIAALRGGNAPDVVSSFTSANVGKY